MFALHFDDKDDVLRLRGRFSNSKLRYEQQYSVLLRSDSHLTKLIIWDAHEATMHHEDTGLSREERL